MKYDLILLDLDDTLMDFKRAEAWALEAVFSHHHIVLNDHIKAVYSRINKGLWKDYELGTITQGQLRSLRFTRLFEEEGIPLQGTSFGESYLDFLSEADFLIPGALEVCQNLAALATLAVVTNGIARVQKSRMAKSPLAPYISAMAISEECGFSKPDPRIFHSLGDLVRNHDPGKILMVGDSLSSDIQGGIAFGVDTCWVNPMGLPLPSDPRPRYSINTITELPEILLKPLNI